MRIRLDAELVRRGLSRSREHAVDLIEARQVLVGGIPATKPATQPDAPPNIEGLHFSTHSATDQVNTAAAVANSVFTNAKAALPFASRAEPALKPNQPNHKSEAPIITNTRLCGFMASLP